jgi:Fe-S-cluster containining protein
MIYTSEYLRIDALATSRFMKVTEPRLVPWSMVASWSCDACGECCKWFSVSVTMHEYARISHSYGHDAVILGVGRAFLRKRCDGRCIFQYRDSGGWLCGLQAEKPYACKMWPFIVCKKPLHGRQQAACWDAPYGRIYVYADPRCPRITFGEPTQYLISRVLPEFAEIAIGNTKNQLYTTWTPLRVVAAQPACTAGGLEEARISAFPFSGFGASQRMLRDVVRFDA